MEELIISLDSLSKENTCAYMLLWMGFLTQSDSNLTRVILESDSSQNFDSSELIKKPTHYRHLPRVRSLSFSLSLSPFAASNMTKRVVYDSIAKKVSTSLRDAACERARPFKSSLSVGV